MIYLISKKGVCKNGVEQILMEEVPGVLEVQNISSAL